MRQVIKGIYLGHINYSESSLIGRFYCDEYGKRSFVMKGVKSKKSKTIGLLQPLNLLEVTSNFKPEQNLNYAFQISAIKTNNSFLMDFRKSAIAMLLAEVIDKSIIEEESNPMLFNFLTSNIKSLDNEKGFDNNFHIIFLLQLSLFLGFYPKPKGSYMEECFNLEEGIFERISFETPFHINREISKILNQLLCGDETVTIQRSERQSLLEYLLRYYEVQLQLKPGSFKSLDVLKTVFS